MATPAEPHEWRILSEKHPVKNIIAVCEYRTGNEKHVSVTLLTVHTDIRLSPLYQAFIIEDQLIAE